MRYRILLLLLVLPFIGCGPNPVQRAELTVALQDAAYAGDSKKVGKLIAAGADVNALWDGDSIAHFAVLSGNVEVLDQLINAGADPDVTTNLGVTPLMAATINGSQDCAKRLISAGVNLDGKNQQGATALILATIKKLDSMATQLINSGADISCQTKTNKTTALMMASRNEMVDVAKLLIKKGADPSLKDAHGRSALDYAKTETMKEALGGSSGF